MRAVLLLLLVLACPVGMCLVPMLLMRRKGTNASCHGSDQADPRELHRLRSEVAALRSELGAKSPAGEVARGE